MKRVLTLLLTLVMLLSLAACGTAPAETPKTTTAAPAETTEAPAETTEAPAETTEAAVMKFKVVVVHQDGTEKTFEYETKEKYLGEVLYAEGLIKGLDGPYGLEITTVDGVEAIYDKDKAYWALYEGEEYALQGIDETPVKDGGLYKLVYTGA